MTYRITALTKIEGMKFHEVCRNEFDVSNGCGILDVSEKETWTEIEEYIQNSNGISFNIALLGESQFPDSIKTKDQIKYNIPMKSVLLDRSLNQLEYHCWM